MTRFAAFAAVLLSLVVSGAGAGLLVGRWGNSEKLQQAVTRLKKEAVSVSDLWDVSDQEMKAQEFAIAELDGYVMRRFVERRTGRMLTVLVVCGKSGPVASHTPDVCYGGSGYSQSGETKTWENPTGPKGKFEVRDFVKANVANPSSLRVFLAWSSDGEWAAPAYPRVTFAGKPFLYKIYVVRDTQKIDEPLENDPAAELIKDLMPRLQQALFPAS